VVDYDIAPSESGYSQRQTFDYVNSLLFNDGINSVTFQISVVGLNNNVSQRPDSRTNSYVMKVYAESAVGFTNEENKVKLHEIITFKDVYERLTVPRMVRPMTIPSIITEIRTS
jgi:hypothetical protein